MKKLLFLAAAAALTLSSCLKGNDSSFKDYENVEPGILIRAAAVGQHHYSTIPANLAIRLAMLVAQAEIQTPGGTDDFSNIMSGTTNVKQVLFGENAAITRSGDDYVITFENDAPVPGGYFISGKLTVKTNGQRLIVDTDEEMPWEISYAENFRIGSYDTDGRKINVHYAAAGSAISIFNAADGSYVIQIQGMRLNLEDSKIYSDWGGRFYLTPPDESLAYSLCKGKTFKYTGTGVGPTCYTLSSPNTSSDVSYSIKEGVYDIAGIKKGTETCVLQDIIYNTNFFPSKSVTCVWSTGQDGRAHYVLTYNGFTMSN